VFLSPTIDIRAHGGSTAFSSTPIKRMVSLGVRVTLLCMGKFGQRASEGRFVVHALVRFVSHIENV
jgi:hypothetical protein